MIYLSRTTRRCKGSILSSISSRMHSSKEKIATSKSLVKWAQEPGVAALAEAEAALDPQLAPAKAPRELVPKRRTLRKLRTCSQSKRAFQETQTIRLRSKLKSHLQSANELLLRSKPTSLKTAKVLQALLMAHLKKIRAPHREVCAQPVVKRQILRVKRTIQTHKRRLLARKKS